MAAVLRVKRRHDDEPLNALIIACKRIKTTENEEVEESTMGSLTTLVKFAGTVKNQESNVVEHLVQTLNKDKLKETFKQHPVDIIHKIRETKKFASAENRYKIISCIRSLDNAKLQEFEDKIMTVIDVEDSVSCTNEKEQDTEKDDDYVYDLYYGQTENEVYIDDMISVYPFDQELVFETYRDCQEAEYESEDSNSESNWRNDYPDSDYSENSIDEDRMRVAVMNMWSGEDSDLSSDDDFVYASNEVDINLYGYKYARYKARMQKELGLDISDNTNSDDTNSDNSNSDGTNSDNSNYDNTNSDNRNL